MRALVIDADAVNRLTLGDPITLSWLDDFASRDGMQRVVHDDIVYLIGSNATAKTPLLVIACKTNSLFSEVPDAARVELFLRALRGALSQFQPSFVKLPLDWRLFHSGSLLSFQTNRIQTGITSRAYFDFAPEGTEHVYLFRIECDGSDKLTRDGYDADLFAEAALGYELALAKRRVEQAPAINVGHLTVALDEALGEANIVGGMPFSAWTATRLTKRQLEFFNAPFNGPLRVKGPAGSGKTLVLVMRFLKEIYAKIDAGHPVSACFLTHGDETAEHIVKYLLQVDERGLLHSRPENAKIDIEIATLHGLGNRFINRDTDSIQPLSLDGSEGRKLQFELIRSITKEYVQDPEWTTTQRAGIRQQFVTGLEAAPDTPESRSFCYDLSDEFANVVETLGVKTIDEITPRYLKARPSERALAQNQAEKRVVLSLYRRFRKELSEMGVVSLDQFTADFLAYLNSFRWDALRRERGFDFVFADELHLFNAQERRVLGYLLREPDPPRRVAVAYDPRQSPRNSFFPEAQSNRDGIWSEAGLESLEKPFELLDVFRYTPQILAFLDRLNQRFPASDLAEEWALQFGRSLVEDGAKPIAKEFDGQLQMAEYAATRSQQFLGKIGKGEQIAILSLDHDRFVRYAEAGIFKQGFVTIASRADLQASERFRKRVVLSMPEYVAGLQFKMVFLLDANANLITELGGGVNGLHRFISGVYLGASRAKSQLEIFADRSEGGLAAPIRDAIENGLAVLQQ